MHISYRFSAFCGTNAFIFYRLNCYFICQNISHHVWILGGSIQLWMYCKHSAYSCLVQIHQKRNERELSYKSRFGLTSDSERAYIWRGSVLQIRHKVSYFSQSFTGREHQFRGDYKIFSWSSFHITILKLEKE